MSKRIRRRVRNNNLTRTLIGEPTGSPFVFLKTMSNQRKKYQYENKEGNVTVRAGRF